MNKIINMPKGENNMAVAKENKKNTVVKNTTKATKITKTEAPKKSEPPKKAEAPIKVEKAVASQAATIEKHYGLGSQLPIYLM